MRWDDSISDFENYLKFERNLSQNTVAAYRRDVVKLKNLAEDTSPETLSYEQLQEILYRLSREGLGERTQARWISSVKTFFKWMLEEDFRSDNPSALLETPKLGKYLPDTLSFNEIEKMIAAIDRSEPTGERNRCIVEVLYGCGLRVSELVNLKISDINFKENYIRVLGKGSKIRLVPLADFTAEVITTYKTGARAAGTIQANFEDFLFLNRNGRPLTRNMVFIIIKNLAAQAGIRKNISPHTFRHSYATHLLQNGADLRFIQEMLGHSSITTTEIYTHLQTRELRDAILNCHPRNKKI